MVNKITTQELDEMLAAAHKRSRNKRLARAILKYLAGAFLIYLMSLWIPVPAAAEPYSPAFSQSDAQQAKAQFQASSARIVCTTCSATLQVWKTAELAKTQAQCQKDYSANQQQAQKCSQFWQTFLQ